MLFDDLLDVILQTAREKVAVILLETFFRTFYGCVLHMELYANKTADIQNDKMHNIIDLFCCNTSFFYIMCGASKINCI